MEPIHYAQAHQMISALHSIVCIPKRHWLRSGRTGVPEPGTEFELSGSSASVKKLGHRSRWRVAESVWIVRGEPLLDAGCLAFFRALWPFYDDWIRASDELYCFTAVPLERPPTEYLCRWIAGELANRQ